MLHSAVLASAAQRSEPAMYTHIPSLLDPTPTRLPSPLSRSPQSTELSSPHYTAGSRQPSILHMVVHIHQSQSPNSSPPPLVSTHPLSTSASPFLSWLLFFFLNKFIYFWLRWVFAATRGLSLVVASRGYSSLWCAGFSLWWLLLLQSMGSRHVASVVAAHGLSSCGTQALERRLSSCDARA